MRPLRRTVTGFVTALALTLVVSPVTHAADHAAPNAAASWLAARQAADGSLEVGFGGPVDGTAEALIGLAASDDPALQPRIEAALAYLKANAASYGATPLGAAKLAVVADAYGHDPATFFGVDSARVIGGAAHADGTFGKGSFGDSWILVGLKRAGGTPTAAMCQALAGQQDAASGAYGYVYNGFWPDVDTTGLALMALTTCDSADARGAVTRASGYLAGVQLADGHWDNPYSPVNTTSLAAMGRAASGTVPTRALAWLLGQQAPGGGMLYQGDPDPYATAQALPVLGGRTYLTVAWTPAAPAPQPSTAGTATTTAPTKAPAAAKPAAPAAAVPAAGRPRTNTASRAVAPAADPVVVVSAPVATPDPEPSVTPSPSAFAVATTTPTPASSPAAQPVAQAAAGGGDLGWYLAGGVMLVAAAAGGVVLARRKP